MDFHNGGKNEENSHNQKLSSSSQKHQKNVKCDDNQSEVLSESSSTRMSTKEKLAQKARDARVSDSIISSSSSELPKYKSTEHQAHKTKAVHLNSSLKIGNVKTKAKMSSIEKIMEMKAAMLLSSTPPLSEPNCEVQGEIIVPESNTNTKQISEHSASIVDEAPKTKSTNLAKIMQIKADLLLSNKTVPEHVPKTNSSQRSKIESIKDSMHSRSKNGSQISKLESLRNIIKSKDDQSLLSKSSNSKLESVRESLIGKSNKPEDLSSPSKNHRNVTFLEEQTAVQAVVQPTAVQSVVEQLKLALKGNNLEEFLTNNTTNLLKQNTFNKYQEPEVSLPLDHNLVMVHGKYVIPPVTNINNVGFMNELLKELKEYNRMRRIQSYTWPGIIRGQSMVIISPEKSGKTLSYLPITCNLVANEYSKGIISDKYGPIACIIVPTSVEVEHISKLASHFLRKCDEKIPVVGMFGVREEKECMVQLLQLCGIFVGTPSCYRKLLAMNIAFFDQKRIKMVVIDEVNLSNEFEVSFFTDYLKKIVNFLKKKN